MGPLEGVTVLDIGHVLVGPFAATLLGDLGADVIKVEPPTGDSLRTLGPSKDGHGLWWKVSARNKRCITLDLRAPRGQEILRELARGADVLIENFRPGMLEQWGIGWDVLSGLNPDLIMLRLSGFGQDSSSGSRPMFGRPAEAMSGLLAMSGFKNGPPVHNGFPVGDLMTSMVGAFGIVSALYRRQISGAGEMIDMALFETPFRAMEWLIPVYEQLGIIPGRTGNESPLGPVVANVYQSKDGRWMSMSAGTENVVKRILMTVGGHPLLSDHRFSTPVRRQQPENHQQLMALIGQWISERSSADVARLFLAAGAVISPANTIEEIMEEPIFAEREMVVTVDDQDFGPMQMPGVVPKLTNWPSRVRWSGAHLGQHNDEIYTQLLGLSAEEVEGLRSDGII